MPLSETASSSSSKAAAAGAVQLELEVTEGDAVVAAYTAPLPPPPLRLPRSARITRRAAVFPARLSEPADCEPALDGARVDTEYEVIEEVAAPPAPAAKPARRRNTNSNNSNSSSSSSSTSTDASAASSEQQAADSSTATQEAESEAESDGGAGWGVGEWGQEGGEPHPRTVSKLVKRIMSVPLALQRTHGGPLQGQQLAQLQALEARLKADDAAAQATEEARNELEALVYRLRARASAGGDLARHLDKTEHAALALQLEETEEWTYNSSSSSSASSSSDSGSSRGAAAFAERASVLHSAVAAAESKRRSELVHDVVTAAVTRAAAALGAAGEDSSRPLLEQLEREVSAAEALLDGVKRAAAATNSISNNSTSSGSKDSSVYEAKRRADSIAGLCQQLEAETKLQREQEQGEAATAPQ
eukprot:16124-Heterococcus_DN1.PRE.1